VPNINGIVRKFSLLNDAAVLGDMRPKTGFYGGAPRDLENEPLPPFMAKKRAKRISYALRILGLDLHRTTSLSVT
jgi:hypothetical protein